MMAKGGIKKTRQKRNEKPLSLYPLPFEEALALLLKAKPIHKKKKKKITGEKTGGKDG